MRAATKIRRSLAPGVTRAEAIYQALRQRIVERRLAPGARLARGEIAAEFGTSRAPVAEAIGRLAADGLVEVSPRSGSYIL
jgi:GntR family transcriptional regulator, rspAB operon transcriptional repressor